MGIDETQLELIGGFYDAAVDDRRWPDLLDSLATQLGAKGCALLMIETLNRYNYSISATNALYSDAFKRTYEQKYSQYEAPTFSHIARGAAGVVVKDLDYLADPERFRNRPDVVFLREQTGAYERFALKLNDEAAWFECITFQYDQDRGNVTANERRVLDLFVPHLARAAALSRTFSVLRARFNAVLGALDRVHIGMMVVSGSAEIAFGNSTAWNILGSTPGLSVSRDRRLRPLEAESAAQLRHAISNASATADARSDSGSTYMKVPKSPHGGHLLLEISPLRDPGGEIDLRFRGAIVSIVDPDRMDRINCAGLQALYGLTATEIVVLESLVAGRSNLEIAEIRGVSPETVKTQTRSVFAKLAVRNRAELVRRVLAINLPIDGAGERR